MVDILAISPHPDDVELSMGGALLSFKKDGFTTGILDLTNGEPTPAGDPATRMNEAQCAGEALRLDFRETLDLENRFLLDSKEARIKVAEILRAQKPKIVFAPYWDDAHPDHIVAHFLAIAGVFTSRLTKIDVAGDPYRPNKVIHYFASHLRCNPEVSFILDITDFFEEKMQAVKCYRSQFFASERGSWVIEIIESMARYWGGMIGVKYGEIFCMKENVGLRSIKGLVY